MKYIYVGGKWRYQANPMLVNRRKYIVDGFVEPEPHL